MVGVGCVYLTVPNKPLHSTIEACLRFISTSSGAAAEYQRVLSPFMKEAHRSDKVLQIAVCEMD